MTRLLLVEDQQDVARTLARALTILGYRVQVVVNCEQARAFTEDVDCAVLDIDLPDGSGLDLARHLKSRGISRLVFYSGCADPETIDAAQALGVFVPKLAGVHELVAQIERTSKPLAKTSSAGKPSPVVG